LREESFTRLLNRKPEQILEQAIKGMLPKSKMGRQMGTKLKVYRGESIAPGADAGGDGSEVRQLSAFSYQLSVLPADVESSGWPRDLNGARQS